MNVAVPSTQTPTSLNRCRLKIVNHVKFEAVPQLTIVRSMGFGRVLFQ